MQPDLKKEKKRKEKKRKEKERKGKTKKEQKRKEPALHKSDAHSGRQSFLGNAVYAVFRQLNFQALDSVHGHPCGCLCACFALFLQVLTSFDRVTLFDPVTLA